MHQYPQSVTSIILYEFCVCVVIYLLLYILQILDLKDKECIVGYVSL